MIKSTLFVFTLVILIGPIYAQEIISNQGNSYSTIEGKIDFTVGEPIIKTLGDANNNLTQGFHQYSISVTEVKDYSEDMIVSVFPNPVTDQLTIRIDKIEHDYFIEIIDLNGKTLLRRNVNSSSVTVDVSPLSSGLYFLNILSEKNEILKTFKIQKNNIK